MSATPAPGLHPQARRPNGYAALLCAIVQQALRDAQGKGIKASSASHPRRVQQEVTAWMAGACLAQMCLAAGRSDCRDEILDMIEDATHVRLCDADLLRAVTKGKTGKLQGIP